MRTCDGLKTVPCFQVPRVLDSGTIAWCSQNIGTETEELKLLENKGKYAQMFQTVTQ